MTYRLISIEPPLLDYSAFEPIRDEIISRFGDSAIQQFPNDMLTMNLAKRTDLAKLNEWPGEDPSPYHNLLRQILPTTFSESPVYADVSEYAEIPLSASRLALFTQFTPSKQLSADHEMTEKILDELGVETNRRRPFTFQIALGNIDRHLSHNYRQELKELGPKSVAFGAGKLTIKRTTMNTESQRYRRR